MRVGRAAAAAWIASCGLVAGAGAFALAPRALPAQSITTSGSPAALRVSAVTGPGGTLVPATNAATTYTVTGALLSQRKVTAQLSAAMPSNTTLEIQLAAPTNATSAGWVTLATTAKDVVTAIPAGTPSNTRTIQYRFTATIAAGVVAAQSRTVTLTIVAGP
jgi:hypothetical protein